jgi:hypothetical protein
MTKGDDVEVRLQRIERKVDALTDLVYALSARLENLSTVSHNAGVAMLDRVVALETAVWEPAPPIKGKRQR